MAWIFVDRENEGSKEQMRSDMRRHMRGGSYRSGGYRMGGDYREDYNSGYKAGYEHGWQDHAEDEEDYRRSRDSYGRYK